MDGDVEEHVKRDVEVGAESDAISELCQERDLYAGLLDLNRESDAERFLKSALELISGIVGADSGCLELFDTQRGGESWFYATGFSEQELEDVRATISRGIVAEAVATGGVVLTPSAFLDPRFRDRASVQRAKTTAVLCAAIGEDPPRGVLYLQSGSARPFRPGSVKPVEIFTKHLAPLVTAFEQRRSAARTDRATELRAKLNANEIIGQSRALAELLHEVDLIAPLDVGVLIHGDGGSGKTQLARVIHRNSQRASGPFVELNCAAIPENLTESELFGSVPGAFTSAVKRVEGKIASAENGTLFLDEIGDLALAAQAKLLQFLQSKLYYPLGSATPVTANTRVIAATRLDLAEEIAARRFREDLYYRLQIVTIRVPSLAERSEDVPAIAAYFCERAQRRHKLPRVDLSPAALRALEAAEWPGNVRELSNLIERVTIRVASRQIQSIEPSDLFGDSGAKTEGDHSLSYQNETRRFQEQLLLKILKAEDWNISATARRLDLTRTHVYNLIRSFGLKSPAR